MPDLTFERRLMAKVIIDEAGCWIWQGFRNAKGYGSILFEGKITATHRATYRYFVGPIPLGQQLDHVVCSNTSCCNPRHVVPATPRENTLRSNAPAAQAARMTECRQGHPFTVENTIWTHGGTKRRCRTCHAAQGRENKRRVRAASQSDAPARACGFCNKAFGPYDDGSAQPRTRFCSDYCSTAFHRQQRVDSGYFTVAARKKRLGHQQNL